MTPDEITLGRICFIGGGNMARAIMQGLASESAAEKSPSLRLFVVDPSEAMRENALALGAEAAAEWPGSAQHFDIVVLAVKPQMAATALAPLAGSVGNALVVSVMAGVRCSTISQLLGGHRRIVRCMPNTPAMIGAGITALYSPVEVVGADRDRAELLLASTGKTLRVSEESQLDAVTAVSGSGPAYVFYFIEALERAAIESGLPAETARALAIETFRGASLLAAQSSEIPATLRENVTSKRGTTEAALSVLAEHKLDEHLVAAVRAARARAFALGNELEALLDAKQ